MDVAFCSSFFLVQIKNKKVNENYMRIIEDAKVERDDAVGQKDGLLKAREEK